METLSYFEINIVQVLEIKLLLYPILFQLI
jgi:hypothetical protein